MTTFDLPQYIEDYRWISDKLELQEKLRNDAQYLGMNVRWKYTIHRLKYLYAKCCQCSCHISYKFSMRHQLYILNHYSAQHRHSLREISSNKPFMNFIESLPNNLDLSTAKKIAMKQFNIKSSSFYYYFRKIKRPKISFKDLVDRLDFEGYHIQIDPYDHQFKQLPEVFLAISPLMKENFAKYGQWCCLDMTFNLIQQNSASGKDFKLGCFMGLDNCLRIVPFGFIMISEETKERYSQIVTGFCQNMPVHPKIMISDQSPALIAALIELKQNRIFMGTHLFDHYHILKNIKKKLKKRQNLQIFSELIKCQNQKIFEKLLSKAYEKLDDQDINVLTKFVKEGHQYCYSLSPVQLMGFSVSDGCNQKFHDMIKNVIRRSKPYTTVAKATLNLLEELGLRSIEGKISINNFPYQKIYDWQSLKQIRYTVDKKVFERIVNQIGKSLHCDIIQQMSEQIIVYQHKFNHRFKVVRDAEERWRCNCNYSIKSGVPCYHQIKVYLAKCQSIRNAIHERWLIVPPTSDFSFKNKKKKKLLEETKLIDINILYNYHI